MAPEGQKVRLAKAAGAEPSGQMRDEKLHTVVARSTFRSQNVQNTSVSDDFWKLRCRKVHAVVARSTFRSQNVQNTPAPDHFWKLRCRKKVHAVVARSTFRSQNVKTNTRGSDHLWRFRCRFAWQAQGIVHLLKNEQNVGVLWHFQKRWQARDI